MDPSGSSTLGEATPETTPAVDEQATDTGYPALPEIPDEAGEQETAEDTQSALEPEPRKLSLDDLTDEDKAALLEDMDRVGELRPGLVSKIREEAQRAREAVEAQQALESRLAEIEAKTAQLETRAVKPDTSGVPADLVALGITAETYDATDGTVLVGGEWYDAGNALVRQQLAVARDQEALRERQDAQDAWIRQQMQAEQERHRQETAAALGRQAVDVLSEIGGEIGLEMKPGEIHFDHAVMSGWAQLHQRFGEDKMHLISRDDMRQAFAAALEPYVGDKLKKQQISFNESAQKQPVPRSSGKSGAAEAKDLGELTSEERMRMAVERLELLTK